MQRQKFRRTPKSLSSSQVIVRFVVAGIVLFALVFLALLVNHWYLINHSKAPGKMVSSDLPQPQSQPQPANETSSSAPAAPSVEEKPNTSLTFYDRLVHKETPDSNLASDFPEGKPVPSPESAPVQEKTGAEDGAGYMVQVGSFQSLESAEKIVESLKSKGYSPSVATVAMPNGKTWHRVRIGSFNSRDEAETLVQKLKEGGNFEPMIIAPEKGKAGSR